MRRGTFSGAMFVMAAAAITPACRQLASIHERSSEQTLCSQCVTDSCSSEVAACLSSTCATRLDCALACDPTQPTDLACQAGCAATSVSAVTALGAVDSCAAKSCDGPCAIQCGGVLTLAPVAAASACESCIVAQCCAEASACAASTDCLSGLECARGESAPDTVQTCTDVKYAAGSAAYHALDDCAVESCGAACAVGADWGCLGHFVEPVASTERVTGTLTVVGAITQTVPIPGVQVVGCGADDGDCVSPLTPVVTTGSNGVATLTLPTVGSTGEMTRFEGYLQITDPSNQLATDLVFVNPETSQPGSVSTVIMAPTTLAQDLGQEVGVTVDVTQGALLLTAVDCANRPAPGVTFQVQAGQVQPRVYYTVNTALSASATETDANGTALVVNVPPGGVTVTASLVALARQTATVPIFVRGGAVSILRTAPSE